jgi:molybdopterin converting factor small subunit
MLKNALILSREDLCNRQFRDTPIRDLSPMHFTDEAAAAWRDADTVLFKIPTGATYTLKARRPDRVTEGDALVAKFVNGATHPLSGWHKDLAAEIDARLGKNGWEAASEEREKKKELQAKLDALEKQLHGERDEWKRRAEEDAKRIMVMQAERDKARITVGELSDSYSERINVLSAELGKLRTFKAYVHERLDEAGVPPCTELECRVGGRLAIVLDKFCGPKDRGGVVSVNMNMAAVDPDSFRRSKRLIREALNGKPETVQGTAIKDGLGNTVVADTQAYVDQQPVEPAGVQVPPGGPSEGYTPGPRQCVPIPPRRAWTDHKTFSLSMNDVQDAIHAWAKAKGWLDKPRSVGEVCMLFVSEVAELFEDHRNGLLDSPSTKIPSFSRAEEEAADIVIRVLQEAGVRHWRLADAILAKMEYNEGRPFRHGNKAL